VFDATARKYSQIQFEKINVDQGDPRCQQYQASSIPKAVFLDSQNKVVYSGSVWGDVDSFGQMIK
jgi:hypothetical protein